MSKVVFVLSCLQVPNCMVTERIKRKGENEK